ncbi:protein largen [Limosa lapponica baueri]|uniref:Protein largen n=1 Tax=Limosa lapponica baueri TaxID=1758121 RepID=A0A2I0TGX4_LIMLA|nr:protein largen [Limosa lapponica baueri]
METVSKLETQPSTITVAPVVKKKQWKQRLTQLLREEEEAPPKRESRKKNQKMTQEMQKDYNCPPGKWTTAEEGVHHLRELAVVEVVYRDLGNNQAAKDLDDAQFTRSMWQNVVRNTRNLVAMD